MLLKFAIANYRSFKDNTSMDMKARAIKEHAENIFALNLSSQPLKVIKCMVIYGPNSTGKSNFFSGFCAMRHMVIHSANASVSNKDQLIHPFKLSAEYEHKPTMFECTMLIKNVVYRYGFKCNQEEIVSEWLTIMVKRREEVIFKRTKNDFQIVKRFPTDVKNKLTMLCEFTRKDTLYLSVLAQFNIEMGTKVVNWFSINTSYSDTDLDNGLDHSAQLLRDSAYNILLKEVIQLAGLDYIGIDHQEPFVQGNENNLKVTHIRYDAKNKPHDHISLDFKEYGSLGAQKTVALLGPVVKTLVDGGIVWVDDLDAKVSPAIINLIINLYHSARYNKNGAQLIIIAHNQEILKQLRRDQLIFMNKNNYGVSTLSAISLYKPQRFTDNILGKDTKSKTRYHDSVDSRDKVIDSDHFTQALVVKV